MWMMPPVDGLVELTPAPVIWVDDIGAISLADDVVTTYYYSLKESLVGRDRAKNVELIIKRTPRSFIRATGLADSTTKLILAKCIAVPRGHPPNGWTPRVV